MTNQSALGIGLNLKYSIFIDLIDHYFEWGNYMASFVKQLCGKVL